MRLPVLIQYSVWHAQPGGRMRQKPAFEIVDFDVAAATTDEAPIAVRWNDRPHPEQIEGWDHWNETGDGHTRWFGGCHWKPLLDTRKSHSGPLPVLDFDTLEALSKSPQPAARFLGNWSFANLNPPRNRPEDCPDEVLRKVVGDTRNDAIKSVKEELSKLLFVDGVAYEACHEPRIVMIQAIVGDPETNRSAVTTRSMRIVADELVIRMAVADDPDRVVPVTRFEDLHSMNRLFDRYGITEMDEIRRPEIELWASIDEDAHWDKVAMARIGQFLSAHSTVTLGQMNPSQLSSVKDAIDAKSIADRDERLEAFERVLGSLANAWPKYDRVEALQQLALDLGGREINVPIAPAIPRRATP